MKSTDPTGLTEFATEEDETPFTDGMCTDPSLRRSDYSYPNTPAQIEINYLLELTNFIDNTFSGLSTQLQGATNFDFGADQFELSRISGNFSFLFYLGGLTEAGLDVTVIIAIICPDLLADGSPNSIQALLSRAQNGLSNNSMGNTSTKGISQIAQNGIRGREFERQVINALGTNKNNNGIKGVTRSGIEGITIPDTLLNGLTEIKDVINLSFSPQLQIQYNIASRLGVPLNLVVSQNTNYISAPLQRAIQSTNGTIQVFNSNSGVFSPW